MLIDPPIEAESSRCESLVGLLTRASSTRSSLPRVSYPSGFRCSGSPRLQWRGPCRVRTGFPNKPDRQIYIPEHRKESSQTFAGLFPKARSLCFGLFCQSEFRPSPRGIRPKRSGCEGEGQVCLSRMGPRSCLKVKRTPQRPRVTFCPQSSFNVIECAPHGLLFTSRLSFLAPSIEPAAPDRNLPVPVISSGSCFFTSKAR
jgi:hypothetical protein